MAVFGLEKASERVRSWCDRRYRQRARVFEAGVEGAGVAGAGVEGESVLGLGVVGERDVGASICWSRL